MYAKPVYARISPKVSQISGGNPCMRFSWFFCLLLASMAFAQTTPSTPAAPRKNPSATRGAEQEEHAQAKPAPSNIPPDTPVITMKGICDDKPGSSGPGKGDCQTVVTRAQFEKMADAIQPNMPANVRQRLASAYPRLLLMAHEAQKRGLDKEPRFEELMQFARLQILNQELNRSLQEESAQIPDKDIADYYHNNSEAFEMFTLERIFIPARKQGEP